MTDATAPPRVPARNAPISVVIPVYNEVENLRALHAEVTAALDPVGMEYEVLLVNDGSTDGSMQLMDEIHKEDPRFRVIHFIRNYGQTAAMAAGIRHASNPVVVSMDADLQNDPKDIPMLLDQLDEGYDLVCGWRKKREDNWVLRKVPSKIANRLISSASGVVLHDYGCTLKAYRKEYVEDIPLFGQMHRFIPIYVTWAGARMKEVPVNHRARRAGVSKYGLSRTFRVILDLITTVFLRDFYSNPSYFFGYYGFGAVGAGVVCATAAVWMKYSQGTWMHKNPLVALAAMFVLLGFNSVFIGLLAEILIRMNFEIQKKVPYRIRQVRGVAPRMRLIGLSQTPDGDPSLYSGTWRTAGAGSDDESERPTDSDPEPEPEPETAHA